MVTKAEGPGRRNVKLKGEATVKNKAMGLLISISGFLPFLAWAGFSADDGVLVHAVPSATQAADAAPAATRASTEAKAAPSAPTSAVWVARSGSTLRKTLEEWGRSVDWKVVWEPSDLDYPIPATRTFDGTFETALSSLFEPYLKAQRSLWVDVYQGNAVVTVTAKQPARARSAVVVHQGDWASLVPLGDSKPAAHWKIQSGERISEALSRWAKSANWQLVWDAPELVAEVDIDLSGSLEDVVGNVVTALNRTGNSLQAKFYNSNRVLRIVERK